MLVALISYGRWGSLSLALLYLLFRRGKNSLAFALGLGAATAFIALLPVAADVSRSRHLAFFIPVFSGILPPFGNLMNGLHPQLATLGTLLLWLFSISLQCSGKQYCRIPEDGARGKGDRETAIGLSRRNVLRTRRLAGIHAAWPIFRGLRHLNFSCPAARLLTHLTSESLPYIEDDQAANASFANVAEVSKISWKSCRIPALVNIRTSWSKSE